jgi:translation initiation factor 2-alpha kinase 4
VKLGYYNTWTEEVNDVSETDEDTTTTEAATTEDSVSEISPGGPNIEFGVSTGGLDFMSSSGYPQIEFGYDDASDNEDSGEDEEDISTNPDEQGHNGGGNQRQNNLVGAFSISSLLKRALPRPISDRTV